MNLINRFILIFSACYTLVGCKKLVEIEAPPTSLTGLNVYAADATASAVLTALYAKLSDPFASIAGGKDGISFLAALSADELALSSFGSQRDFAYYQNSLSTVDGGSELWFNAYSRLAVCNAAIEGLTKSETLTPAVKEQLLGEAKFMRAFFYFYLVNFYGKVPLVVSTDYKTNSRLARAEIDDVYEQIITDLTEAKSLLKEKFLMGDVLMAYPVGEEVRVRPTKWAASALLSRVYLFRGNYVGAEAEATGIINSDLFDLGTLDQVFTLNNREAIWQLQTVNNFRANTGDGALFVLTDFGFSEEQPAYISDTLYKSFETGDTRKSQWIGSITLDGNNYLFPYKYKAAIPEAAITEYLTVFRLAEQFLIRAEARAKLGNIEDSRTDLDAIRLRAGLEETEANSEVELIKAIVHERQVELFTEWGHRWLDLKRLPGFNNSSISLADEIMPGITSLKGGEWSNDWKLYPVLLSDIQVNPNLQQNKGY